MQDKFSMKDISQFFFVFLFFVLGILVGVNKDYLGIDARIGSQSGSGLESTFLQNFHKGFKNDKNIDFRLLDEAYQNIAENYYSYDTLSSREIVYGMIRGLVESLGDKHSEFFDQDETKKFNEALSGNFEGIGAVVVKNDFGVSVDRIIAGSPAKEAGIEAGDIITKANGVELKNMTVNDAVLKIRGPAGSKVVLDIVRPGEREAMKKEVTRRKIEIPSLEAKMLDKETGYIILSIYGEKSGDEFKKSLADLRSKGMKTLIVDLRDNGGGFLETAVSILSNFIGKDKTLVITKGRNQSENRSLFSEGGEYEKIPVVILINENSASASEITAGAMKDYNRGVIVGVKSYGKGSVQQPFALADGSEMKITVAKWYTPLDNGIDGIGIPPDVESIIEKKDYEKKYDRQLEDAKKVMLQIQKFGGDIKKTKEYYLLKKQSELKEKFNNLSLSGTTSSGSGKQ